MPTTTGYQLGFWERNPKLWEELKRQVAAVMTAAGWNPKAKKFQEVQHRKAHQLWVRTVSQ